MQASIAHNQPLILPEDRQAVDQVLQSGWLATGKKTRQLENFFASYMEEGQAVAVSSGTAALFIALHSMQLGKGHKVAIPTYSCSALLNAVYMVGAEPVIIDSKNDDFTICPNHLSQYTNKLDAIIAVHTYGAHADIKTLQKFNVPIIEDCCQSLGGYLQNIPYGKNSHCAVFSFYATKIVAGGYGGLIWDRDGQITNKAKDYINFDCRKEYIPRFNFQISDIQSALILSQLQRLENIKKRRIQIAQKYDHALPIHFSRQKLNFENGALPYRYVIRAKNKKDIEKLRTHMQTANINCNIPVERYELLHQYLNLNSENFPNSEHIVETSLSIPLYPGLSDGDVDRICETLNTLSI